MSAAEKDIATNIKSCVVFEFDAGSTASIPIKSARTVNQQGRESSRMSVVTLAVAHVVRAHYDFVDRQMHLAGKGLSYPSQSAFVDGGGARSGTRGPVVPDFADDTPQDQKDVAAAIASIPDGPDSVRSKVFRMTHRNIGKASKPPFIASRLNMNEGKVGRLLHESRGHVASFLQGRGWDLVAIGTALASMDR